jgi:hypothetical protein
MSARGEVGKKNMFHPKLACSSTVTSVDMIFVTVRKQSACRVSILPQNKYSDNTGGEVMFFEVAA